MINNIGMANVCYVPLNWIFNRGQSPKVYSLVSKKCMEEGYHPSMYYFRIHRPCVDDRRQLWICTSFFS